MHVHLEQDAASLQREVAHRLVDGSGGVVHQDVDRSAEHGGCFRHDAQPVAFVGEIGDDHRDGRPVLADPMRGVFETAREMIVGGERPSGDGDVGTFRGQTLRGRGADASARAGHERTSPCETLCHERPHSARSVRCNTVVFVTIASTMTQTTTDTGTGSDKARATRAALIRSACDFFVEDGYGAVSVRDLARRTKLTSGAIYGHFRNKADLLVAAVNEKLVTDLEAPQRGRSLRLAEYLAAQAKNYRSRAALRALIVEGAAAARVDPDIKQQLRALQTAKLQEWRAIYRELQQSEHLDPDADMETLVVFLWAAEMGLGVLEALDVPLPKPSAWARLIESVVRSATEDSTAS